MLSNSKEQQKYLKIKETLTELYSATYELSSRGLVNAASCSILRSFNVNVSAQFPAMDVCYLNAKMHFDLRDYDKVYALLKQSKDEKSKFLKYHSLYLSGEKRKYEGMGMTLSKEEKKEMVNPNLEELEQVKSKDPFMLYLRGIVLNHLNKKAQAKESLIESLKHFKFNWSAYKELLSLLDSYDDAVTVANSLNFEGTTHEVVVLFFLCYACIELHQDPKKVFETHFDKLIAILPDCHAINYLKGMYFYTLREYEEAEQVFEQMFKTEPYELDFCDVYSNILFVKENKVKLAELAQSCVLIDKFRPETCCVIGNYYSLRGEHEKAILYFRRALKLNRYFLSAWTLMGHEFLELGNSNAALESYRRAIEINERDYRAWFGLGQTYEMLSMTHFALYYYQKACVLRPLDSRMWSSLAAFYENIEKFDDAFRAYQRAVHLSLPANDNEDEKGKMILDEVDVGIQEAGLWLRFAKICDKVGKKHDAVEWYRCVIGKHVRVHLDAQDVIDAFMFLARYYKNKGNFKQAEDYVSQLMEYSGPDKEEAKALIKELGSM